MFIPVVFLGDLWFGLGGIIWALTITEVALLLVGLVMCLASRRGLAEGSPERAEAALEEAGE
ncbi:hypothetical protein [Arthrobacter sp. A5]|uniref:hypothetical protein n=1 Tax=Arthrobacter sp. A5 TaxID=576926 RepID=UPI003DA92593